MRLLSCKNFSARTSMQMSRHKGTGSWSCPFLLFFFQVLNGEVKHADWVWNTASRLHHMVFLQLRMLLHYSLGFVASLWNFPTLKEKVSLVLLLSFICSSLNNICRTRACACSTALLVCVRWMLWECWQKDGRWWLGLGMVAGHRCTKVSALTCKDLSLS